MSWWTDIRDGLETAAAVVANYYYPGSGVIGQLFNSKGSQEQLGSWLGQAALLGGGIAGGAAGNMSNYGTTLEAMSGGAGGTVGGTSGGIIGGASGTETLNNQYVQQLLDQGYTQEQALSMAQQSGALSGSGAAPNFSGQTMTGAAGSVGGGQSGGTFGPFASSGGGAVASAAPQAAGQAAGAGSMPWGSPGNLASMGQGVLGLAGSAMLQNQAIDAQKKADPFGPYREQYAQQMAALSADPSLITKQPGYEAGMQAVQRSMAAQGYTGSGNMMAALAKYGGDFYNQTMQMYSGLAGAQFNPATAAQLGMAGTAGAINLAGNSLNRMGYGAQMAGGWPWQQQQNNPYSNAGNMGGTIGGGQSSAWG